MVMTPPRIEEGFILRTAKMDDADSVLELVRACDIQVDGQSDENIEDLRSEWEAPTFELERDTRVIISPDGRLIGYSIVYDSVRPVTPTIDVYVHPDYQSEDWISNVLMDWAEKRAEMAFAKVPADARVAMHAYTFSHDTKYKLVLERAGMQPARHYWRMMIQMEAPPPAPEWPEGVTVRQLLPDEDRRPVLHTVRAAFKDHWGYVEMPFEPDYERFIHNWEDHFDPALWYLAMDGDQIIGVNLCRRREDDDGNLGWVGTLAVRREYRKRGIGMALLRHSFGQFYADGYERVGLGVDAGSLTGATRLYEDAGMKVYGRFDLYEKELRPGVDYTTQEAGE